MNKQRREVYGREMGLRNKKQRNEEMSYENLDMHEEKSKH